MAYGSKMLSVLRASQLFEATGTSRFIPAIQSKCGFSKEHFELTVGPVLCGFAEFVQQLPGSRGSDYDNPGGTADPGSWCRGSGAHFAAWPDPAQGSCA